MTALLPRKVVALARRVVEENKAAGRTIAVAESCTGGLVAAAITEIPGSSAVLDRGFVVRNERGEAVRLCLHAFEHGSNGDLFVQKAPAVTIDRLSRAVLAVMDRPDHPVRVIGTRHGEKLYETLLSREEMAVAEDRGEYYRVAPDNRDLNYDAYFREGEELVSRLDDFNSTNTRQLDVDETAGILRELPFVRTLLAGDRVD